MTERKEAFYLPKTQTSQNTLLMYLRMREKEINELQLFNDIEDNPYKDVITSEDDIDWYNKIVNDLKHYVQYSFVTEESDRADSDVSYGIKHSFNRIVYLRHEYINKDCFYYPFNMKVHYWATEHNNKIVYLIDPMEVLVGYILQKRKDKDYLGFRDVFFTINSHLLKSDNEFDSSKSLHFLEDGMMNIALQDNRGARVDSILDMIIE